MAVGQNQWYHFGEDAPPIVVGILVGIGVFTGGTGLSFWCLLKPSAKRVPSQRRTLALQGDPLNQMLGNLVNQMAFKKLSMNTLAIWKMNPFPPDQK